MKKILLISLLSLILTQAQAITVISNAGGLAEMKFRKVMQFLPLILKTCVQSTEQCYLDAAKVDLLRKILSNPNLSNLKISFSGEVKSLYRWIDERNLEVNSNSLYLKDLNSIPASEMIEIGLAALAFEQLQKNQWGALSQLQDQMYTAVSSDAEVKVHKFSMALSGHAAEWILLEDKNRTEDLTEEIKNLVESKTISLGQPRWSMNYFSVKAKWLAADKRNYSGIVIITPVIKDGEVDWSQLLYSLTKVAAD